MKIIISSLLFVVVAGYTLTLISDAERLANVKSGTLTLECHIGDSMKVIDPAKVVNFIDGRWIFTNGSAVRCLTY